MTGLGRRLLVVEYAGGQDACRRRATCIDRRVSVLEDTNNDGKMDKKTVFLDKLVLPRALKVLERGVLVGEPPNVWLARVTNGDLRSDAKEMVTDTYGQLMANVEHNANSLLWGLDNWLHTSEVDTLLRSRTASSRSARRSPAASGAHPGDAGRSTGIPTRGALRDIVPTLLHEEPSLTGTRGSYETPTRRLETPPGRCGRLAA